MNRPGVITVGFEANQQQETLRSEIEALGLALVNANDEEGVDDLLRTRRGSAVLVYTDGKDDRAFRVLQNLKKAGKSASVVVVSDEPDFGAYVDLMSRGAAAYLSMKDGPSKLAQAVQRASRR